MLAVEGVVVLAVEADDRVAGYEAGRGRRRVRLDLTERDADGRVATRRCR